MSTARETLAELTKSHQQFYDREGVSAEMPMLFLFWDQKGDCSLLPGMFAEVLSKQEIAGVVRRIAGRPEVVRYAHVSEMWFAALLPRPGLDPKDLEAVAESLSGETPPSQRDDRREGVITVVCDRGQDPVAVIHTIERDWQTGRVTLVENEDLRNGEGSSFSGRFVNPWS